MQFFFQYQVKYLNLQITNYYYFIIIWIHYLTPINRHFLIIMVMYSQFIYHLKDFTAYIFLLAKALFSNQKILENLIKYSILLIISKFLMKTFSLLILMVKLLFYFLFLKVNFCLKIPQLLIKKQKCCHYMDLFCCEIDLKEFQFCLFLKLPFYFMIITLC